MTRIVVLTSLALVALGCGSAPAPTPDVPAVPSAAPAEPAPPPPPAAVWKATGFQTPESVLYDEAGDRYLVSNINGKPGDVDGNGYISEVSPDGKVTTEKWIAGGQKGVKLDAPKGTGIANGVLYVADITTVRMFDLKTGAAKGEVKIPGATFLNDIATGPDGKVYVSDSGIKFGEKGPEPTGTDAVWVIDKGAAKALAKSKDLGAPNGLLVTDKGVLCVTFGSGELYRLDDKGAKQDVTKMPKGSLDGIVQAGDSLLISSWEAQGIFKGKLGGTFELVFKDLKSPADIGFDKKRSRVLVPHFEEGTVEAFDVK